MVVYLVYQGSGKAELGCGGLVKPILGNEWAVTKLMLMLEVGGQTEP